MTIRTCAARGMKYSDDILETSYPAIGANILVMALEGLVFFSLTILLELNFFVHKLTSLCMSRTIKPADIHLDDVSKLVILKFIVVFIMNISYIINSPYFTLIAST